MLKTVTDTPPFRTYRPYQTKFVKSYARSGNVEFSCSVLFSFATAQFVYIDFHNVKAQTKVNY